VFTLFCRKNAQPDEKILCQSSSIEKSVPPAQHFLEKSFTASSFQSDIPNKPDLHRAATPSSINPIIHLEDLK
jgi:hypothetical protein